MRTIGMQTSDDDQCLKDMNAYRSTPLQQFFAAAMQKTGAQLYRVHFSSHGLPDERHSDVLIRPSEFEHYACAEKDMPPVSADASDEGLAAARNRQYNFLRQFNVLDQLGTAVPMPGIRYQRTVPVIGIFWDREYHKDEHVRFDVERGKMSLQEAIEQEQASYIKRSGGCRSRDERKYFCIPTCRNDGTIDEAVFNRFRAEAMAAQPTVETVTLAIDGLRMNASFLRMFARSGNPLEQGTLLVRAPIDWLQEDECLNRSWQYADAQTIADKATAVLDAYLAHRGK
jgi:hypothetical protein